MWPLISMKDLVFCLYYGLALAKVLADTEWLQEMLLAVRQSSALF